MLLSQITPLYITVKGKADLKISHGARCQNLAGTPAVQDSGQGKGTKACCQALCQTWAPWGAPSSDLHLERLREPSLHLED